MKILFVEHEGRDGIGTHSAGLRAALPAALADDDQLVVAGLTGRRSRRGARIIEQQVRLPFVERDADLVHLPDFRPTLLDRRPTLLTVHDVCFLDHPDWFPSSVYRYKSTLLRLIRVKRPAAIVCVPPTPSADSATTSPICEVPSTSSIRGSSHLRTRGDSVRATRSTF